ncbi:MAG: hypothetical protein ACRD04_11715 [Terriglobales bacterium]
MREFWHDHSLSLTASAVLATWLILYSFWDPNTHWGNFFGNAIADWSGVVVMMLAAGYLYERGSSESEQPPLDDPTHRFLDFARDHSLTLFLLVTLAGWLVLYIHSGVNTKWGQVVGNVVSEWVQSIGMVLLTKKLIERRRGKKVPNES